VTDTTIKVLNVNRAGKSVFAYLAKEHALNVGKTVIVATPDNTTKQKRRKHLTMIEPVSIAGRFHPPSNL